MNKGLLNIVIVDDDRDDALWLSDVVEDILPSCTCHFEHDGIAALRFIKYNPAPDVVFLDLNMPLKNGVECLRDIFNNNLLPNTPIIIYSTSANIKDIDQSYKYGAVYYIVKPTCKKMLKSLVTIVFSVLGNPIRARVDKSNFVLMEGLSNRPTIKRAE